MRRSKFQSFEAWGRKRVFCPCHAAKPWRKSFSCVVRKATEGIWCGVDAVYHLHRQATFFVLSRFWETRQFCYTNRQAIFNSILTFCGRPADTLFSRSLPTHFSFFAAHYDAHPSLSAHPHVPFLFKISFQYTFEWTRNQESKSEKWGLEIITRDTTRRVPALCIMYACMHCLKILYA